MINPLRVAELQRRLDAGLGPLPAVVSRTGEAPSRAAAAVLETLEARGEPTGVAELAEAAGQHPNTVREHLDSLVDAGLVVRSRRASAGRGRPAWLYAVEPSSTPSPGAAEYAGLATALAMHLARTSEHPTREAADAGRTWGERLAGEDPRMRRTATAARHGVIGLLDGLGFAPTTDDRATTARLTRCPLLDAAKEEPEVVCAVHLGIVRGALDTWGAPTEGTQLIPFAEPGACVLHLTAAAANR